MPPSDRKSSPSNKARRSTRERTASKGDRSSARERVAARRDDTPSDPPQDLSDERATRSSGPDASYDEQQAQQAREGVGGTVPKQEGDD